MTAAPPTRCQPGCAPPSTAAREAIRIADKHLAGRTIDQRKALAFEIVLAINLCEREMSEIILALATRKTP